MQVREMVESHKTPCYFMLFQRFLVPDGQK